MLCDNTAPCSRCTARGKTCTYSRTQEESPPLSKFLDEVTTTPANFLLGVTDPKADTMIDSIISASFADDNSPPSVEHAPATTSPSSASNFPLDYGLIFWGLDQYQPGEFSDTLSDAFMDYGIQFDPSCSGSNSSSTDECYAAAATSVIVELGKFYSSLESTDRLPTGHYYFDLATAREVLTPENMRTHIAAYFRYTNPYYPIVHLPTFDIRDAPPILLLSLFLCGTLYRGEKSRDYRGLYNLSEEYAFGRLEMAMEGYAVGSVTATKDIVPELQAAVLIHSLQWVISCASSRRRNRDLRLPALVTAARTLGYVRLRHAEQNPEGELDWEKFIELETRIR